MTNAQSHSSTTPRLTPTDVVRAALTVLDAEGIDAVSTRAVASELGVRMNTVLWHVKSKSRLLELMADTIVGEVSLHDLNGTPQRRAADLIRRLRRALLHHRDGARVVAGTFPSEFSTLAVADQLLSNLLKISPSHRDAAWTAWTLFYFTLGLTQEEQSAPARIDELIEAGYTQAEFPSLFAVLDEFTSSEYDARFEYGMAGILTALTRQTAPPDEPST